LDDFSILHWQQLMDLPAVVEVLIQFYLVSINTLLAKCYAKPKPFESVTGLLFRHRYCREPENFWPEVQKKH
jgi:hypothetical protein